MGQLKSKQRAELPDRAFAYVDSRGRRRLPIHDEAHVRNALARFNQVSFESEAAKERAQKRLLAAAKKYGIVPIGFMIKTVSAASKLAVENERLRVQIDARSSDMDTLPKGRVTFLFTDIEGSTGLLHDLGDDYAAVLREVRAVIRGAVERAEGREVDARADEFFAVFARGAPALDAALSVVRALQGREWPGDVEVRVRIGIHSGRPTLTDTGYVGLAVHAAARICSAAHGGQILLSAAACKAVGKARPTGVRFRSLGSHRLRGLRAPETLFQVVASDLETRFPPPRIGAKDQ
jgi:class 3 adenylate cyclase